MDIDEIRARELRDSFKAKVAKLQRLIAELDDFLGDSPAESSRSDPTGLGHIGRGTGTEAGTSRLVKPSPSGADGQPQTRLWRIVDIMQATGRPMRIAEIREELLQAGDGKDFKPDQFYNIIDSTLRTGEKAGIRKIARGLWGIEGSRS